MQSATADVPARIITTTFYVFVHVGIDSLAIVAVSFEPLVLLFSSDDFHKHPKP